MPVLGSAAGVTGVAAGTCRREQPALNWYKLVSFSLLPDRRPDAHTRALDRDAARHQLLYDDTRDTHTHLHVSAGQRCVAA